MNITSAAYPLVSIADRISRKRPIKRKFHKNKRNNTKNVPNHMPGKRVVLNTKREITVDDLPEVVAEEIAFR